MSLVTQLNSLITRVGTEFKTVYSQIGPLTSLATSDKSSLVAAVNEVRSYATSLIDDTTSSSTTKVWSASKSTAAILQAKNDILGGVGAAYDTLQEIVTQLQSDESTITGILTSVGNRLRFDAAQTLTGPQQTQGQSNLGVYSTAQIGDPTTDFVSAFNAALV